MEERTSGIILRTRRMTETSLVVQWLTPDIGRISTVAKGALRPKSPFLGKLDLFYEAEFSFVRSRRSELHNLREVRVCEAHATLRQEIDHVKQAAYFVILIERSTEVETPLPDQFQLLREALAHLAVESTGTEAVLAFEIRLLSCEGYAPNFDRLSKNVRDACEVNNSMPFGLAVSKICLLTAGEKHQLNQFLERALLSVLERVPPQRHQAMPNP